MMKLLLIALLFSVTCHGQTKDSTAAPKQYYIMGTIDWFQLLFKAVDKPGEMTRDEINALKAWLQTVREVPQPPAEKPKTGGKP